jgi:hypothetical protein
MSEETAREIAEREIGRTDEKRKTPERRSYRTGNGRRRSNTSRDRPTGPNNGGSQPRPGSSSDTVDVRRFKRS